jgi:type II secretory pathway pseudopilin PulG
MNLLKKLFRNPYGFTLVETMLAIGISTGAALIVYKVLGESQKGQAIVETKDDINQIHRELVGKFTDRFTCTHTLAEGMNQNLETFPITKIMNEKNIIVLNVPFKMSKITIAELKVASVDKLKNQATVEINYSYNVGNQTKVSKKQFRIELSYKDNKFEGCVTRGTLGLDPKDACDLVVGTDATGKSYFYNGKCNFAKGACEQSGRVWNDIDLKCNFSEDDIEALRTEICSTLGFTYSPGNAVCMPSQALIDAAKASFDKDKEKQ